jgi:hypothetical protein
MARHSELRNLDPKQISADLDAQCSALDAPTLDRINRDRRAALAELNVRRALPAYGWIAGAALAGLAVIALWPSLPTASIPPAPVSMETFTALASPDEADLIDSLDFYLWAEMQDGLDADEAG